MLGRSRNSSFSSARFASSCAASGCEAARPRGHAPARARAPVSGAPVRSGEPVPSGRGSIADQIRGGILELAFCWFALGNYRHQHSFLFPGHRSNYLPHRTGAKVSIQDIL